MKAAKIFTLVLFLASCKSQSFLYYYDNSDVKIEIKECQGFAKVIRENVVYNTKDSMYHFNIGFMKQYYLGDYYSCLLKLTSSQIVDLFGPPNDYFYTNKGDTIPLYFTNSSEDINSVTTFGTWANYYDINRLTNSVDTRNNPRFKPATHLTSSAHFEVETGQETHRFCESAKSKYKNQVFRNNEKSLLFVNATLIAYSLPMAKREIRCSNTFSSDEIKALFGKPSLISGDTIYYRTIDASYQDLRGNHPSWIGKVHCVIFTPNEKYSGYYSFGQTMVNPIRLK